MSLKNKKWILGSAIIFIIFIGCSNKEKATEYNDIIVEKLNKLSRLEDDFINKRSEDSKKTLEIFRNTILESRKTIEANGNFKDTDSFKKAALDLCNFYQEVVNGKWNDKPVEEIVDKEIDLYSSLLQAQRDFAEKFNIEIDQPELSF